METLIKFAQIYIILILFFNEIIISIYKAKIAGKLKKMCSCSEIRFKISFIR